LDGTSRGFAGTGGGTADPECSPAQSKSGFAGRIGGLKKKKKIKKKK
jgi:hypothetical protein